MTAHEYHDTLIEKSAFPAPPASCVERVEQTLRDARREWLSFEAYRDAILAAEARRAV